MRYSYQYVGDETFYDNLESIVNSLIECSDVNPDNILLLTPPPCDGVKYQEFKRSRGIDEPVRHFNEDRLVYVDRVLEFACHGSIQVVDIFSSMLREFNWSERFLSDGLHLTKEGNEFVFNRIVDTIGGKYSDIKDDEPFLAWKEISLGNNIK